jgi:uncharacterized protein
LQAINKIILGTVQFGLHYGINNQDGKPSREQVNSILDVAYKKGIRVLDTAEAYGDSQEAIGAYHGSSSNRFGIITKYSAAKGRPTSLKERIEENLVAMRVNYLAGYMFHSFADFSNYREVFEKEILSMKSNGLIRKFGVSVYTNAEVDELIAFKGLVDFVQLPFNLLDNNSLRGVAIKKAKQAGFEIHTRSVFLQGLFFKSANEIPGNLRVLGPYLEKLKTISEKHNVELEDVALQYAVTQNNIDNVLIGVDTQQQLDRNLHALSSSISKGVMDEVNHIKVKEAEYLNPSAWNK